MEIKQWCREWRVGLVSGQPAGSCKSPDSNVCLCHAVPVLGFPFPLMLSLLEARGRNANSVEIETQIQTAHMYAYKLGVF